MIRPCDLKVTIPSPIDKAERLTGHLGNKYFKKSTFYLQVRNERNQAREETKILRSTLEKESHSYKREKHDLEMQITQLKKEMEKIHACLMKHAGQHKEPERDISGSPIDQLSNDGLKNVNSEDGLVTKARSFSENENSSEGKHEIEEYVLNQDASSKDINKDIENDFEEKQLIQKLKIKSEEADDDTDYLTQKIKMLQLRLDDAQKAVNFEKE